MIIWDLVLDASKADAMTGTLILCADDFGYRAGVDDGILELVRLGHLSAVSCLVTGETIGRTAPRLAEYAADVDIGLHLALTELPPAKVAISKTGKPFIINDLIVAALMRRLNPRQVEQEVRAQVALFREIFNRPPDFIDGHQHVHVLPTVRNVVFSLFDDGTLNPARTSMRDCHESLGAIIGRGESVIKASVITALAWRHHVQGRRRGLQMNQSFRGIYDFDARTRYRARFKRFLTGRGERVLIMCHPGMDDAESAKDAIAAARRNEFDYFAGADLVPDIAAAGLELARFQGRPAG